MHKAAVDAARMRGAAPLTHRYEVDGLRAVAVLSILAFHLDLTGFSGGFVGVDVFFVISGYVILRGILPDLEAGRFSIAEFLVRRMRRILPALTVVLAAALTAGFVFLSPDELSELAGSSLSTMAFGANFFFHDRTGYFASAAHTRPLLHMWSLGIEEQFYILVPLTIAGLMRFWGATAGRILAVLAVASFVYSLVAMTTMEEKHAFYMPMARFWEIAVGGCVAVVERRWGLLRSRSGAVAGLVGLLAIAASVLLLNSENGRQQWVVIAILGAAAVIVGGAHGRNLTGAMLGSRPMVAIGSISFSVYLVHWPLIVFWQLCTLRPLLPHEQVVIALLTLVLAALLYRLVEAPMRAGSRRIGNRPALAAIGAGTGIVAVAGMAVIVDGGTAWRLREPAREAYALLRTAITERSRCRSETHWSGSNLKVCRWNPHAPSTEFVIWGDSHARELSAELAEILGDSGQRSGLSVFKPACRPVDAVEAAGLQGGKLCADFVKAALAVIAHERPKIVVMVGRWAQLASDVRAPGDHGWSGHLVDLENKRARIELGDALTRTIERVRASGARVVVVGPVPEIDYHVPSALVRWLHGVGYLPPTRRADFDLRQKQVMLALAKIGALEGVVVVYPHTVFCDAETCAVADGLRALYTDDDHLSPFGAARVGALVRSAIDRIGWNLAESDPTWSAAHRD